MSLSNATSTSGPSSESLVHEQDDFDPAAVQLDFEALFQKRHVPRMRVKKNVSFAPNHTVHLLTYTLDRRSALWKKAQFYGVEGSDQTRMQVQSKYKMRLKVQRKRTLKQLEAVRNQIASLELQTPYGLNNYNHKLCTSLDCTKCASYWQNKPSTIKSGFSVQHPTYHHPNDFITQHLRPGAMDHMFQKLALKDC